MSHPLSPLPTRVRIGYAYGSVATGAFGTDPGLKLVIGKSVTVGHMAMVHGCTIGDHTLVGINSVILNRAVIGKCCVIGANALVTEGKKIPDYPRDKTPVRVIRRGKEDPR